MNVSIDKIKFFCSLENFEHFSHSKDGIQCKVISYIIVH